MLRKINQLVNDFTIPSFDAGKVKEHVNMLHCVQFSRGFWNSISRETIQNCWHKAGYVADVSEPAAPESKHTTSAYVKSFL